MIIKFDESTTAIPLLRPAAYAQRIRKCLFSLLVGCCGERQE